MFTILGLVPVWGVHVPLDSLVATFLLFLQVFDFIAISVIWTWKSKHLIKHLHLWDEVLSFCGDMKLLGRRISRSNIMGVVFGFTMDILWCTYAISRCIYKKADTFYLPYK